MSSVMSTEAYIWNTKDGPLNDFSHYNTLGVCFCLCLCVYVCVFVCEYLKIHRNIATSYIAKRFIR